MVWPLSAWRLAYTSTAPSLLEPYKRPFFGRAHGRVHAAEHVRGLARSAREHETAVNALRPLGRVDTGNGPGLLELKIVVGVGLHHRVLVAAGCLFVDVVNVVDRRHRMHETVAR